jgi:hypothetical protein
MLGLALKAGVPLIRVTTTDLVNLPEVLRHVAGGPVKDWPMVVSRGVAGVHYTVKDVSVTVEIYSKLVDDQGSLILVNQGEGSPLPFDAGELPVPKEMVNALLREVAPKDQVPALASCCSGLTLKAISELARMVMAQDKALTPKGIMVMRSALAGKLQGLAHVDTHLPLYLCPLEVETWVHRNRHFFLNAPDERLIPRGILFHGLPGTGKTTAAKYIAREFGVQLYRLDLSAALSKWVSESEANLSRILTTVDQEEPCVLLVDEVEKLFAEREDSGVTARLLSQKLWWMAEHQSRVLTVMTTNNLEALPKELYRERRIDRTILIEPLDKDEALKLAMRVALEFFPKMDSPWPLKKVIVAGVHDLGVGTKGVVHAKVVQMVYDLIKEGALGKLKSN